MSKISFIAGATSEQLDTVNQMVDQGFKLSDDNAPFDENLGVVPVMKREGERIYILVCGATCSEAEWQEASTEEAA